MHREHQGTMAFPPIATPGAMGFAATLTVGVVHGAFGRREPPATVARVDDEGYQDGF